MTTNLTVFQGPEHHSFTLGKGLLEAILIHGFPGTPAELRPVAEILNRAGWTVHVPLLPGFGPDIMTIGETSAANWLAAAHAAWGRVPNRRMGNYKPSVLVGYSLGAAIALLIASIRPPDYLILISPFWNLRGGWQQWLLPLLRYTKRELQPLERADFGDPEIRTRMQYMLPDIDLQDAHVQTMLREDVRLPLAVIDSVRSLGRRAYRAASDVTSPTLVLQGTDDEVVHPADTRQLLAQLGGPVIYHELPGQHKFLRPGEDGAHQVYELIRSFLPNSDDN